MWCTFIGAVGPAPNYLKLWAAPPATKYEIEQHINCWEIKNWTRNKHGLSLYSKYSRSWWLFSSCLTNRTRLISIVSKPIKVVVVVVVIVVVAFWKKKLGPKTCWSKNNPWPKNFRPNSFGSKENFSKKVMSQKFLVQKIKVQQNLGPKQLWVQQNLGSKMFWVQ